MEPLNFTKMHGAGNDFIIIDNRKRRFTDNDIIEMAPELCDRRFGIGADGLMTLHTPENPSLDYTMFYRNADGSDAGMCGNGARCLALYAAEAGLGSMLTFNVHNAIYEAAVNQSEEYVTISFPMEVTIKKNDTENNSPIYQLHTGTEHVVLEVSESDLKNEEQLRTQGKQLRNDPQFNPPGTNVNFIRGIKNDKICIKTYEKGVEDLTLACGTGAIASALTWHHMRQDNSLTGPIIIKADGGELKVDFEYNPESNNYDNITLGGNAKIVFKGTYAI